MASVRTRSSTCRASTGSTFSFESRWLTEDHEPPPGASVTPLVAVLFEKIRAPPLAYTLNWSVAEEPLSAATESPQTKAPAAARAPGRARAGAHAGGADRRAGLARRACRQPVRGCHRAGGSRECAAIVPRAGAGAHPRARPSRRAAGRGRPARSRRPARVDRGPAEAGRGERVDRAARAPRGPRRGPRPDPTRQGRGGRPL